MPAAKRLEELQVWLLACELRDAVARAVAAGSGNRDFDFREQILRSSRSAPSNVAEGYGYFKPRQFARHLRIARGSLMETKSHIYSGKGTHFSDEETGALLSLTNRTIAATSRLIRYLDTCPADLDLR
jgi:four helix bundle protein